MAAPPGLGVAEGMSLSVRVSVVVSTYNRVHLLRRSIPSLLEQTFPADHSEIIVVVDKSTDETLEYLQSLHAPHLHILLHDRNRGLAAARQTGLTAAQGEFVLFLDDDMVADRELAAAHVAAHEGKGPGVVFGAVFLHGNSRDSAAADCFNAELGAFYLKHKQDPTLSWDGTWVFMNSSAPKSLLLQGGGFDERFRQQREDLDLGLRLEALGAEQRYAPAAIAYQLYDKTPSEVLRDAKAFARGDLLLVQEHPEYRTRSAMAGLVRGPRWRRALRRAIMCSPVSLDLLLGVPFRLAERGRSIPMLRRIALRLLRLRKAVVWSRAVLDQTPGRSWTTFESHYR